MSIRNLFQSNYGPTIDHKHYQPGRHIDLDVQLHEFNKALMGYQKSLGNQFNLFVKSIASKLFDMFLARTPVDSGGTRESWNGPDSYGDGWLLSNYSVNIGKLEFGGFMRVKDMPRNQQKAYWFGRKEGEIKPPRGMLIGSAGHYTKGLVSKQAPQGIVRKSLDDIIPWIKEQI